jgi:hypothetical protein
MMFVWPSSDSFSDDVLWEPALHLLGPPVRLVTRSRGVFELAVNQEQAATQIVAA